MTENSGSKTSSLSVENEISEFPVKAAPRKYEILYFNILTHSYLHIAALYGIYLCYTQVMWSTILFHLPIYVAAEIGINAGAHRLWSHRSFKAKWPLQLILMICNTLSYQNTAIHWVRDHRLHHKYTDTDADPHNASRGFFYSHWGWLLVKKHPEVVKRGKFIEMSDIYSNQILMFQKKYALPFIGTVCFVLPTIIPMYFWGESLNCAWHLTILRYVCNLNATFLVNSAAHLWGFRPYDKSKQPAQNIPVTLITFGEGFHNFHHVFSWDYRSSELGNNVLNFTTLFIDFFAKIGWAYDLKTIRPEVIRARQKRTGDGKNLWGWGDKDIIKDDINDTQILNADANVNSWCWDDHVALNMKHKNIFNTKSE